MAAKKQIADLHARLTADVTQYDGEMRKAAAITARTNSQVNQAFNGIQKGGLKVGLGMLGAGSAVALLSGHIKGVIRDIDNIPGLNPDVVNTINSARAGVADFENTLKRATANLASMFVNVAQNMGLAVGALIYGKDAAMDAARQMAEDGANFYKTQPKYVEDLTKATQDLAKAEADLRNAGESAGQGTDRKLREATAARESAKGAKDELEAKLLLIEANKKEAEATRELSAASEKVTAAQSKAGAALAPMIGASLKGREAIDAMRASITRLQYELTTIDTSTAAGKELAAKKWEEMSKVGDNLNKKLGETKRAAMEIGYAFQSSFEDAILEGAKLKDVMNGLIKDIARIALRNAITAPLGNWIGGAVAGAFGGGKASGGPVDGGTTYMVGEKGPELFTPSGSGTITPNHKLAGGGDSFNFSYSIGSGVTAQQLGPILAMHKRDLLGTIADAKRRRMPATA